MKNIKLNLQLALFGNYDDVTPNVDTIKYFLEGFSNLGLIPNQFHELSIDPDIKIGTNGNRLSFTSSDQSWDVRFGFNRMDILFSNSNIGVTEMISEEEFLAESAKILDVINEKFKKKVKRIGYVNQNIFSELRLSEVVSKFSKPTPFHNESLTIEFNNKIASRSSIEVPEDEIVNISSELNWLKTTLKENNNNSPFEGLSLTTDVNTIQENTNYRFDLDKIKVVSGELSKISNNLLEQYFEILEKSE